MADMHDASTPSYHPSSSIPCTSPGDVPRHPANGLARWLFVAMLGWLLGSALQLQQVSLWPLWAYAAAVLAALLCLGCACYWRRQARWSDALVLIASAALALALTGWRSLVFVAQALPAQWEGQDLVLTGVVVGLPQYSAAGLRFRFRPEQVAPLADGQTPVVPPLIELNWYASGYPEANSSAPAAKPLAKVQAGERWRLTVRLKIPHANSNPHGFDYALWLWEQGVQATGYVRDGPRDSAPQQIGQSWRAPLAWLRQFVRDRILAHVSEPVLAGLVAALVVGDQGAVPRAEWALFRDTGMAHLVSISGLHITMFAWVASALLGWLWRRSARLCGWVPAPEAALLGGVCLATLYGLFSGWGLPAQRTCLMLGCVAALRMAGAHWPWPQVLLFAAAAVVVADPWALLQPGFWLSFVAVAVLFATDPSAPVKPASGGIGVTLRWALAHGVVLLRTQCLLTLALAPLTLLWFGQVSVVGLVANLLAVPWVTLVVTPLAMFGVAWPALWDAAALSIQWWLEVLRWFVTWPVATLRLPAVPLWLGLLSVPAGLLLVLHIPWYLRALGLATLLPVLLWQPVRPAPGQFEVLAADVGQGNAVLVRTASHAMLYDAGPRYGADSDAGDRVLVPLLQSLGVSLDTLVVSHRDSDHAGGAASVLADHPQAALRSSVALDHPLQALRPVQRCVAGQQWEWDGVRFAVLHPQAADYARGASSNALSCVVHIQSASGHSALLAGDIEKAQEARLVASGLALEASLLLIPHHGSRTSSTAAFLDAVRPAIALAQTGYRNRFGHPQAGVVQRYQERNSLVLDSPHCGALLWRSDAPQAYTCHRQARSRYWHSAIP